MHRHLLRALCIALTATAAAPAAVTADVARYFQSSADPQPRGDAGWAVSGTRMRLAADVSLRAPNGAAEIRPKVTSMFTLSERVGLETRLHLPEWNDGPTLIDTNVDTRLRIQAPAPFLDELEGRIWRSRDGQTGRVLKLGFYQKLSAANPTTPITIRSRATLETASTRTAGAEPPAASTRRLGLETEIRGFVPGSTSSTRALRLRVEKSVGAEPTKARSLAYDHAWKFRNVTELALNLGMREARQATAQTFEPSIGIRWHGRF